MPEIPLKVREQIVNELQNGNTISAIKLYREATGTDLSSAKQFVEQLEVAIQSGNTEEADSSSAGPMGMSDELLTEIIELLRKGAKIPAIKVYRTAVSSSLREAKEAVEKIARDHDIAEARSGCGATAALLGLASIWVILWCS